MIWDLDAGKGGSYQYGPFDFLVDGVLAYSIFVFSTRTVNRMMGQGEDNKNDNDKNQKPPGDAKGLFGKFFQNDQQKGAEVKKNKIDVDNDIFR